MNPELSYIVSAYNRPDLLPACLWSLYGQNREDFEVIVTDNATDEKIAKRHQNHVAAMRDLRFRYIRTAGKIKVSDCYWSSEYAMKQAKGFWLCFPCDDNYYPPQWAQRMLGVGARYNLDLVFCENSINGPETNGSDRYLPLRLGEMPFVGYKASFIIRASKFKGWLNKPTISCCSGVDLSTLQRLCQELKYGVCRDLYYVHN
jgi:glycosyltransferase involved in cell wall biosynthesis